MNAVGGSFTKGCEEMLAIHIHMILNVFRLCGNIYDSVYIEKKFSNIDKGIFWSTLFILKQLIFKEYFFDRYKSFSDIYKDVNFLIPIL